MNVYVDMRCLQDENYAFRGVGFHSSTLLKAGRQFLPPGIRWIGLISEDLPQLPNEYSNLVNETSTVWVPERDNRTTLFVQLSPMTHDGAQAKSFLSNKQVHSVAVVYDFIPLDVPERYLADAGARGAYLSGLSWLGQYDQFSGISEYTAKRQNEVLGTPDHCMNVSGVALRQEFENILDMPPVSRVERLKAPYFLFVGGGDPRKNVDVVLQAHASMTGSNTKLVLVGGYRGKLRQHVYDTYLAAGGKKNNLQFQSGISDSELVQLYRRCVCTVCSSEIEGFSLPPVESLASGSPVLLSRNAAHAEFIADGSLTFECDDVPDLAEKMERMLSEPKFNQSALVAHKQVPRRFTLDKVSYRFWNFVTQGLRQKEALKSYHMAAGRRSKVAFLTPFPPDRSGVADYTRRSIEEIGRLVDVDVYCETTNPAPTSGVENFFPLSDAPFVSGKYDATISVVGNSHFHTKIIEAQVEHGGPCLIHDNRLAELYNWWKGPLEFQKLATQWLGREVGFDECQEWVRDPGKLPSLFYDELIPKAKPLILHSKGICEHVKRLYGVAAAYLPFCIYRDFYEHQLTPEHKRETRSRLGIKESEFAIITLGLVSPHKAPDQCIEAISLARQQGIDAHLYFVGSIEGQQEKLHHAARKYGVEDAIHLFEDWIDEQKYVDFVLAADMAIQLRNHFFGGLSGAMLDCIASGLVTIANEDLAQALDSPKSVLRVSDELKAEEIAAQILNGATNFDVENRLSETRSNYVEAHSFEEYASQFCELLDLNTSLISKAA